MKNILFSYSAKKADYLLTVSEYSRDRIKEYYHLKDKNILITPNGVGKEYFLTYDKEEAINYIDNKYRIKNFILYISRIEPRKNQQGLLKSFLELDDPNTQLVFIGVKSINNKEFNNVLDNLKPEQKSRIHILQDISNSDLLYFYRAAKVFVYPTFAEGFGIPPLEAAALKIPVLCSNKTAMKDFDFFSPYFIDISNINEFNNRLNHLLKSKNNKQLEN